MSLRYIQINQQTLQNMASAIKAKASVLLKEKEHQVEEHTAILEERPFTMSSEVTREDDGMVRSVNGLEWDKNGVDTGEQAGVVA